MRAVSAALMFAALAATVTADPGHAAPNAPRMRRHAQKLSEACRRRGRSLDDACLTDPETTGGPYVWDTAPIRKDITEGWDGIPFQIQATIVNSTTCEAISGAAIEIWHCTPNGIYSHFIEASVGNGTATDDRTFLRGVQYTDSEGVVAFDTIWPGWYSGRATHVHIRVHFAITEDADQSGYTGGTVGHVGQMFFNDSIVDELGTVYPYSENTVEKTYLTTDIHYLAQGGTYGLMSLKEMYEGEGLAAGVIGTVTIGVDTYVAEDFDDSVLGGSGGSGSAPSSGSSGAGTGGGNMTGGGQRPPAKATPVPTPVPTTVTPVTSAPPTNAPATSAPLTNAPATSAPSTPTPASAPLPAQHVNPPAAPSAPQQPPVTPQAQPSSPSTQPSSPSTPQSAPSAPCTPQQAQPSTPQGFRGNL